MQPEAQTLSGSIEGSGGAGASTSNGQAQRNNSFWQGYTLGFSSPLINPKLIKLNTEVSFRSGSLNFVAPENDQKGSQKDLGYKLGGSLFPAGKFPFTIQAMRDNVSESGTYPSWDGIRGGIVVPPGEPSPDFRTRNKSLTMGWQLSVPKLPNVEFGYRKASSDVTGGPYQGEQRDDQLHLGVAKATARTQQNFRFTATPSKAPCRRRTTSDSTISTTSSAPRSRPLPRVDAGRPAEPVLGVRSAAGFGRERRRVPPAAEG